MGQGLLVLFVLFEYFPVKAGVSECGLIVDACIPFFLYLVAEFLYLPISDHLTTAYLSYFLLECVRALATGFWEEAASKGLVMSGMLSKWQNTIKGRIAMALITGLFFGMLHI